MKKIIFIYLILFLQQKSFSQAIVGNSYYATTDGMTVYGVNKYGDIDTTHYFKIPINTKFIVNGFDKSNNIQITFWRYYDTTNYYPESNKEKKRKTKETPEQQVDSAKNRIEISKSKAMLTKTLAMTYIDSLEYISSWANNKIFVIAPTVFNSGSKLYYGKLWEFNWGVMTLPIKIRIGSKHNNFFDFEEKLNLGFVFGARQQLQGRHERSLNYLAGVGVTGVKVDSLSLKSGTNPTNQSSTAVSINCGVLYQYESFQIGLFVGADFIGGAEGRDWKHQGKPWIGVAVGVSLFSKNATSQGTGTN